MLKINLTTSTVRLNFFSPEYRMKPHTYPPGVNACATNSPGQVNQKDGEQVKYQTFSELKVNDQQYKLVSFDKISEQHDLSRLPFCIKILLENLIRHEQEEFVTSEDIEKIANISGDCRQN